jgi:DNA primase
MGDAPALRVLDPAGLDDSKDPDAFVRKHGVARLRFLIDDAECAVGWRARELVGGVSRDDEVAVRRKALARAGEWLGTLPPRDALEQEDAIRQVAERCGYSSVAVERAFRARYWATMWQRTLDRRRETGIVMER